LTTARKIHRNRVRHTWRQPNPRKGVSLHSRARMESEKQHKPYYYVREETNGTLTRRLPPWWPFRNVPTKPEPTSTRSSKAWRRWNPSNYKYYFSRTNRRKFLT